MQSVWGTSGSGVRAGALTGEHLRRAPAGGAVLSGIDEVRELSAGGVELGEAPVGGAGRWLSVGTIRLATLTVASEPPFHCRSAGTQLSIVRP